jgi:hypothetical protein
MVSITNVSRGNITFVDRRDLRIYIIRRADDDISVLGVPIKDGAVVMPDEMWFRPYRPCQNFGPKNDHGKLLDGGDFACRDAGLTDYEGKS